MIRAVIFDVGGVLVRTIDHSGRRAWESRLALPTGGAEAIVFNSLMGQRAQRGEISDADLWNWVGQRLQLGNQLEAFRQAFWQGDAVDEELMKLIRLLRPHYQTAIISNATDALYETLTNRHPIADAFDLIVGSAYERVMKPEPVIYERALSRLGRRPEEAVFIDDNPPNVAAARQLGMAGIEFSPNTDVAERLRRFGVTINGS